MDHEHTEAEIYRRAMLSLQSENDLLRRQVAEEQEQKYQAYKRIAELTTTKELTD